MVLANRSISLPCAALLGLLRACNMLEFVFTRDELKAARQRIDQLAIGDGEADGVRFAIEAIETAVIAAAMSADV